MLIRAVVVSVVVVAAASLSAGRWPERFEVIRDDEIGILQTAFNDMSDSLQDSQDRLNRLLLLQIAQRFEAMVQPVNSYMLALRPNDAGRVPGLVWRWMTPSILKALLRPLFHKVLVFSIADQFAVLVMNGELERDHTGRAAGLQRAHLEQRIERVAAIDRPQKAR